MPTEIFGTISQNAALLRSKIKKKQNKDVKRRKMGPLIRAKANGEDEDQTAARSFPLSAPLSCQ